MLDLTTLDLIKGILFQHLPEASIQAFIFGSWATTSNRRYSDIDLGLISKHPISAMVKAEIDAAFEASNLPYLVEVVDFNEVSEDFKREALKKVIPLN